MTESLLANNNQAIFFDNNKVISVLIESFIDFPDKWKSYLDETYKYYSKERLDYVDIAELARHIRDRILAKNLEGFEKFFETVELILNDCNDTVKDFVVVGFLESVQNSCSGEHINIWTGFDTWLKPTTKKHWDDLIYLWEGNDAIERYKAKHPNNNELITGWYFW